MWVVSPLFSSGYANVLPNAMSYDTELPLIVCLCHLKRIVALLKHCISAFKVVAHLIILEQNGMVRNRSFQNENEFCLRTASELAIRIYVICKLQPESTPMCVTQCMHTALESSWVVRLANWFVPFQSDMTFLIWSEPVCGAHWNPSYQKILIRPSEVLFWGSVLIQCSVSPAL